MPPLVSESGVTPHVSPTCGCVSDLCCIWSFVSARSDRMPERAGGRAQPRRTPDDSTLTTRQGHFDEDGMAAPFASNDRSAPAANQSSDPQYGHGASPAGLDGSIRTRSPHTGHVFSSPSGVLDEGCISAANRCGILTDGLDRIRFVSQNSSVHYAILTDLETVRGRTAETAAASISRTSALSESVNGL